MAAKPPLENIDFAGIENGFHGFGANPQPEQVLDIIAHWQAASPRSQQSRLGPSQLGGCRAFIMKQALAKQEGRVVPTDNGLKMPAFVGTAVGDLVEQVMGDVVGARTQVPVVCATRHGNLRGHADVVLPTQVWDIKHPDDVTPKRSEGASFEYLVQISVYLIGLIQQGDLPHGSVGVIVYVDRGADLHVVRVTEEEAHTWIEWAMRRLDDVNAHIAAGKLEEMRDGPSTPSRKDEGISPESKCFYFKCPFYWECWGGLWLSAEEADAEEKRLVELYHEGRTIETRGKGMKSTTKEELLPKIAARIEAGQTGIIETETLYAKRQVRTNSDAATGEQREIIILDVREKSRAPKKPTTPKEIP